MSLEIKDHSISKRIKVIRIQETELDKLIFPFNKHSLQSLEYKPFSRFSLAKSVDDVFSGKLSKNLNQTLGKSITWFLYKNFKVESIYRFAFIILLKDFYQIIIIGK